MVLEVYYKYGENLFMLVYLLFFVMFILWKEYEEVDE